MKFIAEVIALLACLIHLAEGGEYDQLLDSDCGTTKEELYGKIVGGNNSDLTLNPWMVKVFGEYQCGGSLITSRFVLTAAHCIVESYMEVHVGEYRTRNAGEQCSDDGVCVPNAFTRAVDRKIVHTDYRTEYKHDIGLLRMRSAVQYSDYVRPICILVKGHMNTPVAYNATGWGLTKNGMPSWTLKATTVYNALLSKCRVKFVGQIDQSQICAANYKKDVCRGDSGGPLSTHIAFGDSFRTFQFGIISFGSRNCNSFSVYTNVTHYREWIVDAIRPHSNSISPVARWIL